ncbi:ABC transporter substrate-binding protein [Paenibacillus glacialis]|uniref:ABC transporter substrate-binding protein n=2 Tax=Paenibacillus glacialis TaxID=494026 RepID=A0A168FCU4_9BACL|nr:ABC transporter substrate-binding protein [Paenibacillus glacialis]
MLFCIAVIMTGCSTNEKISGSTQVTSELATAKNSGKATSLTTDSVARIRMAWGNSGYPSPFAFSSSGPGGFLRNSFLFDTLTWKDENGVVPWLAKSWSVSEDGLQYTFDLEENVLWHDGNRLTADDVVFSFGYYQMHPFMWTGDISQIQTVTAIDDHKVKFTLNQPYAPFLSDLVGIVPIIPKHVWQNVDSPLDYRDPSALVGTGPYILKEYDEKSGQYLFTANDHYFKGKVLVKEVAYMNPENQLLALQKGEVDSAMTYKYSEVQQLEKEGFDVLKSAPTGSAVRVTFNLDHPQLKDKRLRQALAYALDRAEMAEKITGGDPIVGNAGIIPPDSPWYSSSVKQYEYNVTEAEQILDELGYNKNASGVRNGLKLNVMVSSNSPEAQIMQEMLKKVGVVLNIQQVDAATFSTAMGENKYDLAITGHIGLSGDPDYLRQWFLGEASNSWAARGKQFDHATFQHLALEQMSELDTDKRKEMIGEMQNILAEELPTLVLYHRPFYYVFKSSDFNGWFNTSGGIADGIPLWDNKAALIDEDN